MNLLDIDDNNFGVPQTTEITINDLHNNFSLDPDDYEPAWNNLNEGATITRLVNPGMVITENQIE